MDDTLVDTVKNAFNNKYRHDTSTYLLNLSIDVICIKFSMITITNIKTTT